MPQRTSANTNAGLWRMTAVKHPEGKKLKEVDKNRTKIIYISRGVQGHGIFAPRWGLD